MTTKDYQAIAAVFARLGPNQHSAEAEVMRRVLARGIADVMAADNPRFKRDDFLRACQVKPNCRGD